MSAESILELPPVRRETAWPTLASAGLHAALLVAAILLSPLRQYVVPTPPPVAVEIVTPEQFAALQQPAPPPPVLAAPTPAPAEAVPYAPPDAPARLTPSPALEPDLPGNKTYRATRFYAAAILREPGMDHIRKAFGSLAASETLIQLCNIEGLEQIRRAQPQYDPDTLVSYAMRDPVTTGLTLSAGGGAFRSRRKWYRIAFECTVAADLSAVTAFEFRLGAAIPPDQWEEHNLNVEDADE